jgi:hypothetical protein
MARTTFFSLLYVLAGLIYLVAAWDINNVKDRAACQAFSKKHPLDGCDQSKTLVVDATDHSSKFKTVQSGKNLLLACWDTLLMESSRCFAAE